MQRLYETTEEFTLLIERVSKSLGYSESLPLDEVYLIYDECRYETAWWPDKPSAWCVPFSDADLKVLEYYQALKYYYQDSYGGPPLNAQLGCNAIADLYKQFQKTVEGVEETHKGVLYFSHDHLLMEFFTALGLFHPKEHLGPDNREQVEREGTYSISKFAPFASNVAFALYK